jgi:hypothetical protein
LRCLASRIIAFFLSFWFLYIPYIFPVPLHYTPLPSFFPLCLLIFIIPCRELCLRSFFCSRHDCTFRLSARYNGTVCWGFALNCKMHTWDLAH